MRTRWCKAQGDVTIPAGKALELFAKGVPVEVLGTLTFLESLSLSVGYTDTALKHLVGLKSLKHFNLTGVKLTENDLGALGELTALESLVFLACMKNVNLDFVRRLVRLRKLERMTFLSSGFAVEQALSLVTQFSHASGAHAVAALQFFHGRRAETGLIIPGVVESAPQFESIGIGCIDFTEVIIATKGLFTQARVNKSVVFCYGFASDPIPATANCGPVQRGLEDQCFGRGLCLRGAAYLC